MTTLPNSVNPLDWKVPIVNKDGTPTNEFMRKWAQQAAANGSIPALSTAAQVSALLDIIGETPGSMLWKDGTGEWSLLVPGTDDQYLRIVSGSPAWEDMPSIETLLDTIGNVQGDLLLRNGSTWVVLDPPSTDGWVLTWDNTTGLPIWKAAGGGGGAIIGVGAPTTLVEPAGTLYSRSDAAGVYTSTAYVVAGGVAIVQQPAPNFPWGSGNNYLTFTSPPTAGNLLIAIECRNGGIDMAAAGWNDGPSIQGAVPGTSDYIKVFYRYADGTEGTSALQPSATGSGDYYTVMWGWELSGVTGTWATDFAGFSAVAQAAPQTSTPIDAISPNPPSGDFYLGMAFERVLFGSVPTITGFTALSGSGGGFYNTSTPFKGTATGGADSGTATWPSAGADSCLTLMMAFNSAGSVTVPRWQFVGPGEDAGTPPAVVQFGFDTSGGTSVTLGAAPTNGNLLVAMCFNPSTNSLGSGWTAVADNSSGTDYGLLFTKVAGSGESATQTPLGGSPGGTGAIAMWELSGATVGMVANLGQGEVTSNTNAALLLPNAKNCLGLWAVANTNGGTIDAIFNPGQQDCLSNTNNRYICAGHADTTFGPLVGALVAYSTSVNSKGITCLVAS